MSFILLVGSYLNKYLSFLYINLVGRWAHLDQPMKELFNCNRNTEYETDTKLAFWAANLSRFLCRSTFAGNIGVTYRVDRYSCPTPPPRHGGEFLDSVFFPRPFHPHVWDSVFLGDGKNSGPPCSYFKYNLPCQAIFMYLVLSIQFVLKRQCLNILTF